MRSQIDGSVTELVLSAHRLSENLRDTGYEFNAAAAGLIDNCTSAVAKEVKITGRFNEGDPWIRFANRGSKMSLEVLNEAPRFGSEVEGYGTEDLGKLGTGRKTATHPQIRRIRIATDTPIRELATSTSGQEDRVEITLGNWSA